MNRTASRSQHGVLAREEGYALVLVLLLIGVALSSVLFSYVTPFAQTINSDKVTAAAFAQARDALIGRAVTDDNRPGSLPCPDFDDGTINPLNVANDGVSDLLSGNQCPSYIGRLPWRTLGLPDLRDGSGERLWYALSSTLRDHPSAQPINSDTLGLLEVVGISPAINVAAILIAPGFVLGTQTRDAANENNLVNYLEGENANGDNIYVTGTNNDRLFAITSDALFQAVEYRVAREIRANLTAYYLANNYYPFASAYSDPNFDCVPGLTRGRLPKPGGALGNDIVTGCAGLANWPLLDPPTWLTANNWHLLTYYTVAPACTSVTPGCAGVGLITVNNMAIPNNDKRAMIVVAGRAIGAQPRPCVAVDHCLEDSENTNLDDIYVKNLISPTFNDKFMVVAP